MTESEMINRLKNNQKERRFLHTLGVSDEAIRLAPQFGVDVNKAKIAALLHDCAKNLDEKTGMSFIELCEKYGVVPDAYAMKEPALMHAFLGASVARIDYGIDDDEILKAIYYHTTAKADMSPLEKLLYLADMTEPGRTMEQSEKLRNILETDIDEALIYAIGCSIKHVIKKATLIHPDSVHALNYLIEHRRLNS